MANVYTPRKLRQQARSDELDLQFWDALGGTITCIVRWFGISSHYVQIQTAEIDPKTLLPRDTRVIAVPESQDSLVQNLYAFFANSPDRFAPDGDVLIDLHPDTATAFGKRELLVVLWKLAGGASNGQMSEMCKKLDAIFRLEDFEGGAPADWLKQHPQEVRRAKKALEDFYQQWFRYVARHYDKNVKGVDTETKLQFQVRALDMKRNRDVGGQLLPIIDIFQKLLLVDGTLCYMKTQEATPSVAFGMPVTSKLLDQLLQQYSLRKKHRPDLEKVLRLKQKSLQEEEKQEKKRQKEGVITAAPNPCFSFARGERTYNIYYDKETCKFSGYVGSWEPVRKRVHFSYGEGTIPKRFLYQLVGGNWGQLRLVAKAACCAMSTQKLFQGVIVADCENTRDLVAFLQTLSGEKTSCTMPLRQLSKAETIHTLITAKLRGQLIGESYVEEGKERMNPEQWVRLRKLFNGSQITQKDAILGEKKHRNTMQWFVIGDDEIRVQLQKKGIKALRGPYCRIPDLQSEEDKMQLAQGMLWMQIILPLWGFLIMQEKVKEKETENTTSEIVQLFVTHCCQLNVKNGDFLPARELYAHYEEFCKLHRRTDVLKFKDFNDILETEYGQKRVQWHYEKNKNPTGFFSIRFLGLPDQPLCNLAPSPDDQQLFFDRLKQITEIVKDHFVEWPFGGS